MEAKKILEKKELMKRKRDRDANALIGFVVFLAMMSATVGALIFMSATASLSSGIRDLDEQYANIDNDTILIKLKDSMNDEEREINVDKSNKTLSLKASKENEFGVHAQYRNLSNDEIELIFSKLEKIDNPMYKTANYAFIYDVDNMQLTPGTKEYNFVQALDYIAKGDLVIDENIAETTYEQSGFEMLNRI